MRYLVRFFNGNEIINDLSTDDISKAHQREFELRNQYGRENVWIADIVLEILCG